MILFYNISRQKPRNVWSSLSEIKLRKITYNLASQYFYGRYIWKFTEVFAIVYLPRAEAHILEPQSQSCLRQWDQYKCWRRRTWGRSSWWQSRRGREAPGRPSGPHAAAASPDRGQADPSRPDNPLGLQMVMCNIF